MIEKLPYVFESHSPKKLKNAPWMCCKHCGLLYLNNPLTTWCIKMGCNNEYHKDYKTMVKKLGQ